MSDKPTVELWHAFGGITKMWTPWGNLCGRPDLIGSGTTTTTSDVNCKDCLEMIGIGDFLKDPEKEAVDRVRELKFILDDVMEMLDENMIDNNLDYHASDFQPIYKARIELIREIVGGKK